MVGFVKLEMLRSLMKEIEKRLSDRMETLETRVNGRMEVMQHRLERLTVRVPEGPLSERRSFGIRRRAIVRDRRLGPPDRRR